MSLKLWAAEDRDGSWAKPLRRFWWDMLPHWMPDRILPPGAGAKAPAFARSKWLDEVDPSDEELVSLVRQARLAQEERATLAEAKASRLVNTSLTLLGLSVGLVAFLVREHENPTMLDLGCLVLPGLAALCFFLAVVGSLEVDRPGVYFPIDGCDVAAGATALELEERARLTARWTATKKLDGLLQARAWFSRGLVALGLGVAVVLVSWAYLASFSG